MSQASQGESGDDDDEQGAGRQEITWIGAQHLMHGYCGRASEEPGTRPTSPPVLEVRPIAVVRTKSRQARVVRIGPPRSSTPPPAPVEAA